MGPGYRLDKVRTVINTVVDVGVEMGTLNIPKTTRRPVINHVKHHIVTNHLEKFVANTRIGLSKAGGAPSMLFAAQQAHLQSMGFTDTVRNTAALRRTQGNVQGLSLIHISEPTRLLSISYAVFCLKKKNKHYQISTN
eukprot:TRINITY_DN45141_c0_g1_i2.p1 TRINITY_DN45141_c0_g1~~TRINITY_DN45141_c0_g1_i2.p1  ORF type:complete len:138 (-),score=19.33 TRINITY_DN45141_c0_g1_i2:92-505(-)